MPVQRLKVLQAGGYTVHVATKKIADGKKWLDGNPCHEVSLEIGRMARADFILNVTMRQDGRVAGVFAGDMEAAHLVAVEHVRSFAQIPLERLYDVVVVHGGLVGINHYQAEKAAAVAAKAVKNGGYVVVVADTTHPDSVGTESYRRMLKLIAEIGPEEFVRTIQAEDWEFVHDQWGAQVWAKLFAQVPREHIFYFSPQTPAEDYAHPARGEPGTATRRRSRMGCRECLDSRGSGDPLRHRGRCSSL